jgi:lactoylglutathione lyase
MNKWADKCVQSVHPGSGCRCVVRLRWQGKRTSNLSQMFVNDKIGIRAFVFNDPEGYQVEIQQATREPA